MEIDVPHEILVNITVVSDKSWDNVAKIMRRVDKKCIKTSMWKRDKREIICIPH